MTKAIIWPWPDYGLSYYMCRIRWTAEGDWYRQGRSSKGLAGLLQAPGSCHHDTPARCFASTLMDLHYLNVLK